MPRTTSNHRARLAVGVAAVPLIFATVAADAGAQRNFQAKPWFIHGDIIRNVYDGVSDDLLTGGLGKSRLAGAAPEIDDPYIPTAAELRRLAIYNNYRALVDMTGGGGYGSLYGPNVAADGTVTDGDGLIAGVEYLAFASRGHRRENVTLMVQIPEHFDPAAPCIVTAPSSGSRGVYGAIATAGEWGLKNGCAVAYTDKGTGTGAHSLQDNTGYGIRGEPEDVASLGRDSSFTAPISERQRQAYNAETPDRYAFKHAHSGRNPEQDWGRFVLWSVKFAFYVLNKEFREDGHRRAGDTTFTPANTIVIGSSVSNGGGATLRAVELDRHGLIDGVAVSEPNVNPRFDPGFAIHQKGREPVRRHSRPLQDYMTLINVYQGCANLAVTGAPLNPADTPALAALGVNRCASLYDKGLLSSNSPSEQAAEAQQIINGYGMLSEQNVTQPSNWAINVPQGIAVTYTNAYAWLRVQDRLCDYSFGATDPATGAPVPLAAAAQAILFSTSNGIPPTGGVNVINDASVGGPVVDRLSTSASTGRADENLDGALCIRSLTTGLDPVSGMPLPGIELFTHLRVRYGVRQILASGNLHGTPTLIVTGRSDQILPPNHTSRAYYGLNQRVEGAHSQTRYIEVTNGHHLDALNAIPGFDSRFVPLHHYFIQAMDRMYAHLRYGNSLPPSQVVRTVPRGTNADGSVPAIGDPNLPAIQQRPGPDALIKLRGHTLVIPE